MGGGKSVFLENFFYDKIQEKNPELRGFKADDFDKEENK